MKAKRLLYVVAQDTYFCSHRLSLAIRAQETGYEVGVATVCGSHRDVIEASGICVFPLQHFQRSSTSPKALFRSLRELVSIYDFFSPDLVHHVGLKLSLVGSFAAWRRIPRVINAIAGMGYLFTPRKDMGWREHLFKIFLQKGITMGLRVITKMHSKEQQAPYFVVQNASDEQWLQTLSSNVICIPGSVSLEAYPVQPFPLSPPVVVTYLGRLLREKGILEFLEAAKELRALSKNGSILFRIYGSVDPENPGSIAQTEIQQSHDAGVEWCGPSDSVAHVYGQSHIIVLPSYREGMPKSLLEAASCGRPIITTDAPGCKEVILPQETGLLVPVGDGKALMQAIIFLAQRPLLQESMGRRGRQYMKTHFSEPLIHQQWLDFYHQQF